MKTKTTLLLFAICCIFSCAPADEVIENRNSNDTSIYFPTNTSNTWETISSSEIGWNENKLQPLLDFLEEKNTKGFIMLYNGRIVVEQYMNDHTSNSSWYWASAGKTLTSTLIGIAQEEGLIHIDNKVSDYLGTGWTSASLDKENLITCKNLLSMNSGLDDSLGDTISPENLQYVADAGQRWAYHNVYVKLQDVLAQTSNQTWSSYFNSKLKDRIGMSGAWIPIGDLSVYWSTTRSMARFGLLISANGKWENTEIISPNYLSEATNTSQGINESYVIYGGLTENLLIIYQQPKLHFLVR